MAFVFSLFGLLAVFFYLFFICICIFIYLLKFMPIYSFGVFSLSGLCFIHIYNSGTSIQLHCDVNHTSLRVRAAGIPVSSCFSTSVEELAKISKLLTYLCCFDEVKIFIFNLW